MKNAEIAKIVEQVQKDKTRFKELYDATCETVYNIVYTTVKNEKDTEDIVQDIYLTVFKNIHTLNKAIAFNKWLNLIVVNTCRNFLKKQNRSPQTVEYDVSNKAILGEDKYEHMPESILDSKEIRSILLKLVFELPKKQREVIMLYYYNDLGYAEIAATQGMSESAVGNCMYHAKKNLEKRILEKEKKDGINLLGAMPIGEFLKQYSQSESTKATQKVWEKISQDIKNIDAIPQTMPKAKPPAKSKNIFEKLWNNKKLLVLLLALAAVIIAAAAAGVTYLLTRDNAPANSPETDSPAVVQAGAVVRDVLFAPSASSIEKGTTYKFDAEVQGDKVSQNLKWSVSAVDEGVEVSSIISSDGLLMISPEEAAAKLIVTAVSMDDPTKTSSKIIDITDGPAVVSDINIGLNTIAVTQGGSQQFSAGVAGENNPSQQVEWSVNSNVSTITNDGLLTVAVDEPSPELIVTATSAMDAQKQQTFIVAVTPGTATVSDIAISPQGLVSITQGKSQQFTASVAGRNNPSQSVIWSVDSAYSTISPSGVLTVGLGETASSLTVTAVSAADESKSVTFNVSVAQADPTVTYIGMNPNTATIQKGQSQTFSAQVTGNNITGNVEWSVNSSLSSISDSGVLTVASDETATALTVTAASLDDSTKTATASITVIPGTATVSDVSVTPSGNVTLAQGKTQQFNAGVSGTNNPSQLVLWSVDSEESYINSAGLLSVGTGETKTHLTIRATSMADSNQYYEFNVTIVPADPTVSGITMSPGTATVQKGSTQQFTAQVLGTNVSQNINWSVDSTASTIENGLLTVSVNETKTSLTVTATSADDESKTITSTVTVAAGSPTVSGVTVTPNESVSVQQGASQQFSASVAGNNEPSQTVSWSVNSSLSTINPSTGLLIVGANETATLLTVRATSVIDSSKYVDIQVVVTPGTPVISSIAVSPSTATVQKGATQQFGAQLLGTNNSQEVVWTVDSTDGSAISSSGLLTIASGETASTLTVTATSAEDDTKSATATVTVTAGTATVSGVSISPTGSVSAAQNSTKQFSAAVSGTNNPSQTVIWSVNSTKSSINPSSGLLTVAHDETAITLTVRATSAVDSSQYGEVTVSITAGNPNVTGITMSPGTASVQKGGTQAFTGQVLGTNVNQTIHWTVDSTAGSTINSSGVLLVASGETASALTITATAADDSTKSVTATVTVVSAIPTVSSVTVTPSESVSVVQGQTKQFSASVAGTNSPSQTVVWSLTGSTISSINPATGMLLVAGDETAESLTVRAASVADSTKYIDIPVTITQAPPTVTEVSITPVESVDKGKTKQFTATVSGTNSPAQTVTWTVNSSISSISENGLLTVSATETALSLTIRATSTADTTKYAEITVPVTSVTSVILSPGTVTLEAGGTQQFLHAVIGVNSPSQNVTWSITGEESEDTEISESGLLTIGEDETATTLQVKATSTVDTAKFATATVTVGSSTITKIELKTQPQKTYEVDNTFNDEDMTLTATYSDGTTKTIRSGWTYSPTRALKTTDTVVTVFYEEDGVEVELDVPIRVCEPTNQGPGTVVTGRTIETDLGTFLEIAQNGPYSLILRTECLKKSAFSTIDNGNYSSSLVQKTISDWFYTNFNESSDLYGFVVTSDVMQKPGTEWSITAANNYSVPTGELAVATFDVADIKNRNAAFALSFGEAAQFCAAYWSGSNVGPNTPTTIRTTANWNALSDKDVTTWLRTVYGSGNTSYAVLSNNGTVYMDGYYNRQNGIRPALWVKSDVFDELG